jgi:hypothetical protein
MRVGAGEAAQISAVADTDAGDEKSHGVVSGERRRAPDHG